MEGIIALNQEDVTVCGALALGAFEKRELEIFRNAVKAGMNVVDIGANIGLYTVIASHRIGPDGKVFAYEPEKDNFTILTKNIDLNQKHNSIALQIALSEKIEKRNLYLAEDNKGHHSFAKDSSVNIPISVVTDTLDYSLEKYGSPKIDIIKMDIEGAEPLALKGMTQTIIRNPDIIIFTEIYPNAIRRLGHDPLDFLASLAGFGLSIWIIDEDISKPTQLKPENFQSYIEHFPKGESFHNLYASKKPIGSKMANSRLLE